MAVVVVGGMWPWVVVDGDVARPPLSSSSSMVVGGRWTGVLTGLGRGEPW